MSEQNSIELSGIFSDGYGIIPKKLMKMKIGNVIINTEKKDILVKGVNIKCVLAYMLSFTGGGNECFPGIETISEDLEISRDTVIYAIKGAEKLGMLTKKLMYPNNPLRHNNKYILDFLKSDIPDLVSRTEILPLSDGSTYVVDTLEKNNNSINNNIINNNSRKKQIIPNNLLEVIEYFEANGYSKDLAERFFNYYSAADWCDREGKKVLRWKQKAQVWFKPENKSVENKPEETKNRSWGM